MILYCPGKEMFLANMCCQDSQDQHWCDWTGFLGWPCRILPWLNQEDCARDSCLCNNLHCVSPHLRWMATVRDVLTIARRSWDIRDEPSLDMDLPFKGERIMLTSVLCHWFLHDLHEGHQGISNSWQSDHALA